MGTTGKGRCARNTRRGACRGRTPPNGWHRADRRRRRRHAILHRSRSGLHRIPAPGDCAFTCAWRRSTERPGRPRCRRRLPRSARRAQGHREALAELDRVRANPLPPQRIRTPLKSWYRAVISVLVLAGFMQAARPGRAETSDRRPEGVARRALRRRRRDLDPHLGRPGHVHDRDVLDLRERRPPLWPTCDDPIRRRKRKHHRRHGRADHRAGGTGRSPSCAARSSCSRSPSHSR